MPDDLLARLRAFDDETRRENARRKAKRDAEEAIKAEWENGWNAARATLQAGDEAPEVVPDLATLVALVRLLKRRGYSDWIPDMAKGISRPEILDDIGQFRPGQVWFLNLLIVAGQARPTQKKLAAAYSFTPLNAPASWRARGLDDVLYFVLNRIDKAAQDKITHDQEEAKEAAAARKDQLLKAARKRPAIEKQIFAVYWSDRGLRPADIRDKWNAANPSELPEDRVAARKDIRIAIVRGRAFIKQHSTSVHELANLLGIGH